VEHLLPVIIVSIIVAFIMYKNINKVTANIELKGDNSSYEFYAKYARVVERHIKDLQEIVEKNSVLKDEKYLLKDDISQGAIDEDLSSLIRRLAFFETLQAKQKSKKELEAQFFEILSSLDDIIIKSFKKGDELAEESREKLHLEYEKLKEGVV